MLWASPAFSMPLNESTGPKLRERYPVNFDLEGIPRDRETREALKQQLLEGNSMALQNNFTPHQARDMSKPVYVPYVYQEYPKTMYHPTAKTQSSILAKQQAETHNRLKPAEPMFIPELVGVSITVNDKAEEERALAKGYLHKAPLEEPEPNEFDVTEPDPLCVRCGEPKHRGRCAAK